MRGRGLFLQIIIFIVFAVLLCRAVPSLSYIEQAQHKKKRTTLRTWVCTYARHVSERSGRNRSRSEAYVAPELFFPEAWRQDSSHYQVVSFQLQ